MQQYPSSWAEVDYLIRKEVRQRPDLPALSLDDIRIIRNYFWKAVVDALRDTDRPLHIAGFLKFNPRKKQILRNEQKKQYLKEKYEKEKRISSDGSDSAGSDKPTGSQDA